MQAKEGDTKNKNLKYLIHTPPPQKPKTELNLPSIYPNPHKTPL